MDFKYDKNITKDVSAECQHCFLTSFCERPQSVASHQLRANPKEFDDYLNSIIIDKQESKFLCENYIEFYKYSQQAQSKATEYTNAHSTDNETLDKLSRFMYAAGYCEGFEEALKVILKEK